MNVFIFDDSELVRERVKSAIAEIPGSNIMGEAATCREASNFIKCSHPDVVILDISMPDGTGLDLLKEIKSRQPTPIVIMFTNYDYCQYRKQCTLAGADHYFTKSTDFQKLVHTLETLAKTIQQKPFSQYAKTYET